jgi:hypothetical protein
VRHGLIAVAAILGALGIATSAPTPAPEHLVTGWFAGDSDHFLGSAVNALPAKPRVVNYYTPWDHLDQGTAFNRSFVHAAYADGITTFIELQPWDGTQDPPPEDWLVNIASGSSDAQLRKFGAQIASQGEPVWITFAHEMNAGSWYPWNLHGTEGAGPAEWVAAWNRVTNEVRLGAGTRKSLIQWVWAANEVPPDKLTSLKPYLTGAQNVNILAIDAYLCIGKVDGVCMETYASSFGPVTRAVRALSGNLPIFIAETGIGGVHGQRSPQITALVRALRADPASVCGLLWFNTSKYIMSPAEETAYASVLTNG